MTTGERSGTPAPAGEPSRYVPLAAGQGTGPLSLEAMDRLEQPPTEALRPPQLTDPPERIQAWRDQVHEAWLEGDPPPAKRGHHRALIGGVPCLRAGERGAGPLVLYCHGGGYALGSAEVAVPITERLAAGAEVVSIDYRLAPEHPYPAAVDDVLAVYAALRAGSSAEDRDEPRVIAVAGDSAGANLALSLAQSCVAKQELQAPDGLALLSPHVDHGREPTRASAGGGGRHRRSDVDAAAGRWLRQAYCGTRLPEDPAVSPLRGDLANLPPTLIQVGSADSSLVQAARLARLGRQAGSPVTLDVWSGLWHTWHYHRLPEADQAIDEVVQFVLSLRPAGERAPA